MREAGKEGQVQEVGAHLLEGVGVLTQGLEDLLHLCLVNLLPGPQLHVLHLQEPAALQEAYLRREGTDMKENGI